MPRTLAAVLAGSGVAVAGSVMQMSMHNRFVSPTTAGTSQFALVGLLAVALLAPATSVMGKMLVASACAVAGLGEDAATGLGLSYRLVVDLAVAAAAVMTAVSVVVVGTLPVLGLVVPNAASRICGDNLRRALPVVAAGGALLTVVCDVVGRLVHYPYEISVTVIMGVVGAGAFIVIILRGVDRA